ncbi:uncharacterized protein LAJ45_09454 [Morchella importuna]|uniref:uncharacterized protein n=1 Tax=Morchella importuna TaxID=1174673 RepID=UPI001E8E9043|nr:uncharacterized protein LAJ45_09454 [Morchella importuna]KAH8146508.1 hypothetical protein LAJ45_09454 [Morchella importuna]
MRRGDLRSAHSIRSPTPTVFSSHPTCTVFSLSHLSLTAPYIPLLIDTSLHGLFCAVILISFERRATKTFASPRTTSIITNTILITK